MKERRRGIGSRQTSEVHRSGRPSAPSSRWCCTPWSKGTRFWILLLSSKNQVLAVRRTYRGTLNSSAVRVAELFRAAIRENAASVILVHNHPSSDPTPSSEDVRITGDAVRAGALLDVEVLDHVIVGGARDRFISLKERGLGFASP